MKSMTAILLTGLLAILAEAANGGEFVGGPPRVKRWRLVFHDEFDGNKLDLSKWTRSRSSPAFVWNGAKGRLCEDHAEVDGQGHFVIKITRDADKTHCYHDGNRRLYNAAGGGLGNALSFGMNSTFTGDTVSGRAR